MRATRTQRVWIALLPLLILASLAVIADIVISGEMLIEPLLVAGLILIVQIAALVTLIREIKAGREPPALDMAVRMRVAITLFAVLGIAWVVDLSLPAVFGVNEHTAYLVARGLIIVVGVPAGGLAYYSARRKK